MLPIAPEFANFSAEDNARGKVWTRVQARGRAGTSETLTIVRVIKVMAIIGTKSAVVVGVNQKGRKKYASAHDFRRAFGDRWALRVMPPVLMQLMRHESIETTMRFYVGRSVQATADVVWEAYERAGAVRRGNRRNVTLYVTPTVFPKSGPEGPCRRKVRNIKTRCEEIKKRGPSRIRTGDGGFAIRCLTAWRRGRCRSWPDTQASDSNIFRLRAGLTPTTEQWEDTEPFD